MSVIPMCALAVGQTGEIVRVADGARLGARLRQVGFAQGERVCRAYTDARGFLSAYRVGGTMIALRRSDAGSVLVRL